MCYVGRKKQKQLLAEFERNLTNKEGMSKEQIEWEKSRYVMKHLSEGIQEIPKAKSNLDPKTWEFISHPDRDTAVFRKKLPASTLLEFRSESFRLKIQCWPEIYSMKCIELFLETELKKKTMFSESLLAIEIQQFCGDKWVPNNTAILDFAEKPIAEAFSNQVNGRCLEDNTSLPRIEETGLSVTIETRRPSLPPSRNSQRSISTGRSSSQVGKKSDYYNNGMIFTPEDSVYIPWLISDLEHPVLHAALIRYGEIKSMNTVPREFVRQGVRNQMIPTYQAWVKFADSSSKHMCLNSNIPRENPELFALFEPAYFTSGSTRLVKEYHYLFLDDKLSELKGERSLRSSSAT